MSSTSTIDALVELAAWELIGRNCLDEIEALLIQEGTTSADALKLTLFIPSAFAREVHESEGIRFPDQFYVGEKGNYKVRNYADEAIYVSARKLARRWLDEGRPSLVGRVLDWSSESDGLRTARENGLTPTHIDIVHHGFTD
ncbi:MAG: hypothetical protein OMOMHJEC_00370 [Xanthomonadales bacterium]|nr:hypothetical protein [Xanthomonadales bacterium]